MATSSALITYRLEVINFLRSVTVKYTPLSDQYNANLIVSGQAVDMTDPTSWKYYRNLAGEYHPTDTVMTVRSLDTQEVIEFRKETLAQHTLTAAAYRPGQPEYDALCAKYPEQVDLIKSILYPVTDLAAAVAAPDLTLLAFGRGFLEPGEETAIVQAVVQFLDYMNRRWFHSWLKYETYYYITFYSQLWPLMAQCIFAERVRLLRTSAAHTYHIWEHLTSRGLGDYRDILTRRQELYLYSNIDFILARRGMAANLTLLVNELLPELSVGLVGKTVYQSTVGGEAECRYIPQLVSEPVPTQYAGVVRASPVETINAMTYRLYETGDEVDTSATHIDAETRKIGSTTVNSLPTKLLEITPLTLDKKYADLLHNFILDTLVRMITDGRYQPSVTLTDDQTGITFTLDGPGLLAFYYYCAQKAFGTTPLLIPQTYAPVATFKYAVSAADLPTWFTDVNGERYLMNNLLDVGAFVDGIAYPLRTLTSGTAFADTLATLFPVLVRQVTTSRQEMRGVANRAILAVFEAITDRLVYRPDLGPHASYPEWFADQAHPLAAMIAIYDSASDAKTLYSKLADRLMGALIPVEDNATLLGYSNVNATDTLYGRLKQLFVQLCSYNVLFLDTPRDVEHWLFGPKTVTDFTSFEVTQLVTYDPTIPEASAPATASTLDVPASPDSMAPVVAVGGRPDAYVTEAIDLSTTYHVDVVIDDSGLPEAVQELNQTITIGYDLGMAPTVVP